MNKFIVIFVAITFLALLFPFIINKNSINAIKGTDDMRVVDSSATNDSNFLDTNSSIIPSPYTNSSNSVSFDNFSTLMDVGNLTMRKELFLSNVTNRTSPVDSSGILNAPTISTITYTPKFVCGTISSTNGPLRPGYYDSDISIFNRQNYPIKFLWNVVVTDGPSSNAIIKKLAPETSTKISCSDLSALLPSNSRFFEGFVIITLPISGNILGAFPDTRNSEVSILRPVNADNANLVDVQVFYTANALPHLAQGIIIDKISFSILDDPSGKIPIASLNTNLEIPFQLEPDKIYDPVKLVKTSLAQQYGLSDTQANSIKVNVHNSEISTTYQQDDHAISSSRIAPDIKYTN
ncbi:MAG TPA: hypothetical protein VF884_02310 [Nitrososphaeraceae archaeon]